MSQRAWSAEELGLLEDIHTAPQDSIPPLVYADWLQDRGHERYADLIRHIQASILPNSELTDGHGFVHEAHATNGLKRFPLCSVRNWALRPCREQARIGDRVESLYFRKHQFWRGLPVVGLIPWTTTHLDAALRMGSPRHCVDLILQARPTFPPGREGVWSEATPSISMSDVFRHELMRRVHRIHFPQAYLGCSVLEALEFLNASPHRARVCRIEIENRDMRFNDMIVQHIGTPPDVVWVQASV